MQLIHHAFMSKYGTLTRGLENDKTISSKGAHAPVVCHIKSLAMQHMWKDIWINQKTSHLFYTIVTVSFFSFLILILHPQI